MLESMLTTLRQAPPQVQDLMVKEASKRPGILCYQRLQQFLPIYELQCAGLCTIGPVLLRLRVKYGLPELVQVCTRTVFMYARVISEPEFNFSQEL